MARKAETGLPAPSYPHPPALVVPLLYPVSFGLTPTSEVGLVPPTLGALELLRGTEDVGAAEVLAAMTDLSEAHIRCLRWPDVEKMMAAARDLLPPDFWETLFPPAEEAAPPPSPATGEAVPEAAGEDDDLNAPVNMADFMTSKEDFVHG